MAIIDYDDVQVIERLPIDAQDVVTKVILVVAGNRAGETPNSIVAHDLDIIDANVIQYMPWPLVFEYEAPEHAVYGCSRAFALPEGFNPFLPPDDPGIPEPTVIGFVNPGSPSAVRDGDPATHALYASSDGGRIDYEEVEHCYGYRLVISSASEAGTHAPSSVPWSASVVLAIKPKWVEPYERPYGYVTATVRVMDHQDPTPSDLVLPGSVIPAPENQSQWTFLRFVGETSLAVPMSSQRNVHVMRVRDFYPLVLNMPLLEDLAKAQVRLPAANPQRVTVAGYVAPDAEHTIVGWPGGDYTAKVSQHQYELGRTVIDFEQAGAPVGLPAEALEAARERRVAIDRAVAAAAYPVRMGERQ